MVVVSQKNEFLSLICPSLLVSTPGSWSRYQGWRHIWGSQSPAPPALSGGGSPAGPDPGPPSSLRASMSQNLVIVLSPNAVRNIFMASFNLNRWYLPMEPEPFKEMLWIIRLRDELKKKHVIFSDIVTKGGRGSEWNHTFRSCQNSDKMVRWGGVEISLSPFPRLLLAVFWWQKWH